MRRSKSLVQPCCNLKLSASPFCTPDVQPSEATRAGRRYGVVTCSAQYSSMFLIFVGMVLSGSYNLVRSTLTMLISASYSCYVSQT